ncbi:hypothetical protein AUK22_10185 [bacterium CG2_30_54_10]|nr:MAG: hypothetical protein AUK22_10185 [bacterium CG2_30_54_10]
MKFRAVFLVVFFWGLLARVEGLGSLTIKGSAWKKTVYECVIRSIVEDPEGRLFAGTFGSGLWIREGTTWRQVARTEGGLPDMRVSKLALDGEDLLVATAGGGALRMRRSTGRWYPLTQGQEPGSKYFHAMLKTGTDSFLLGSVGEGLFLTSGSTWKRITENEGLPSDWLNDAVAGSDSVWLATYDGLAELKNGKISRVEVPGSEWTDGNINVLSWFRGNLFLGTASGGLAERLNPGRAAQAGLAASKGSRGFPKTAFKLVKGVPKQVHALLPYRGNLWIGTEEGLFSLSEGGMLRELQSPLSESGKKIAVKAISLSKKGLLLGTDIGQIYLFSDKKWECLFDFRLQYRGGQSR